ncbi:presenilin-like protein At2g29900 [Dendrobium catenatum]|uniref:Presenilin n=1 Tax=Dendrobium catenatum TaxID=906689 RepID=A0A2I0WC66_9ASPA|nr:presenilin-like protein At2g29900 [Dendrobium catenatum]PKU73243.1 Presenilin-like protein [Dendrobium catenatum]
MDQNLVSAASFSSSPILETLGEEILRILYPVSFCMFLVVLLVSALISPDNSSMSLSSIASIAYSESSSDSFWSKLSGAFLNSLLFIAVITILTFLLVLLFYLRCTPCLKSYMAFSSFVVLSFLGGEISLLLLSRFVVPIDAFSFLLLLFNFSVVGTLSVFLAKAPISLTHGYLVIIGVLVAYWFTLLPEWTTWALLISMALYDLAAVLLPVGPLRLLVELAISRDEDIPALVYEARPVDTQAGGRRLWRERRNLEGNPISMPDNDSLRHENLTPQTTMTITVEASDEDSASTELVAPLVSQQPRRQEIEAAEGIGLGSSGAIKLGLGDFIFYSVLVGRAALYDFMTVYACYLAIVAGLGVTLLLLAFYRKALPALPVSIAFGLLFYFLTRELLELFVVQCSVNLLMF